MTLWQRITSKMNPPVFFGAALCVVVFVAYGSIFTSQAEGVFLATRNWASATFGWYYMLIATFFLIFSLWLMFGRFKHIKLGEPDDAPEFSTLAWLTMLFSAGMGIGLVFWSVAEPLSHYSSPPSGAGETAAALSQSLRYSFFHWGLHPWAIYLILAVSLSYFHFRHNLPLAPRSVLYPLIGERYKGWLGHAADILCTVGTLLGVATSLGLGAMQVNTGLTEFTDMTMTTANQITIVAVITAVATVSVVIGIHGGIKRLSIFNMWLALIVFLFVLFAGPTLYILETFVAGMGTYLQKLPSLSLGINTTSNDDWQMNWTLFYWGWWISWSPFVGIFTARISRGRTIRELVGAVLLVPVVITFLWIATFGGTGLHMEHFMDIGRLSAAVNSDPALALHAMLKELPFAQISMGVATLLIIVFFITSSDSGSLVDDMVTSGGHPNPARAQRVFWACSEGAIAIVLLMAGGLTAMQNASITAGLPMSALLVVACWGLFRALRRDAKDREEVGKEAIEPDEG